MRMHFAKSGALEVATPALSQYAVTDPQIESLEVRSSLTRAPLYLHTSPEFCMKRLLAAGYPDIFSICRVFRDGESGRRHQPEFTMLEWYRLDFGLEQIIADTAVLVSRALDQSQLAGNVTRLNYRDAFREIATLDPFDASIAELANAANADDELQTRIGCERSDWLDLILSTRVATAFAKDRLTVLQHYPASQAALAQLCPSDASVADRFEMFVGEIEIANGYVELTDAKEQQDRITADQTHRERRQRVQRPEDPLLLSALEEGLPACAGVALGIERLQMIHDRTDNIGDVVTFTFGE